MTFYPADYLIAAATLAAALAGLFIGFSGALGFLFALIVGTLAARTAWSFSVGGFEEGWARALTVLVVFIVVFGLVRWCVKKIVNGFLRQPADAVFGLLIAAFTGAALSLAAVFAVEYTGFFDFPSTLLQEAKACVGMSR